MEKRKSEVLDFLITFFHIITGFIMIYTGYLIAIDQIENILTIKHAIWYGIFLIMLGSVLVTYRAYQVIFYVEDKITKNTNEAHASSKK